MESSTNSSCHYQVNFFKCFKPKIAFRKDNVRIISNQYYHLGCSCVLLSNPVNCD
jgi:hypothetical protein